MKNLIGFTLFCCLMLGLSLLGCREDPEPDFPTLELRITVEDENQQKISGAWVNVFNTRSYYKDYLAFNPQGIPGKIEEKSNEDDYAFTTTSLQDGLAHIAGIRLKGYTVIAGAPPKHTFTYYPFPVYLRVEAMRIQNGDTLYLTNDAQADSLTFDSLIESGKELQRQLTVVLKP